MRNAEIAAALQELGDLYEIDGAVRYRVIAYREAARAIADASESVEEMARQGRATELDGVGKTIQDKVLALVDTGEIPAREKLRTKFPPSLVELLRIPGLGARTVRMLHDELGIATLDDLEAAAKEERLRDLKGMGEKAERNVLEGIARVRAEGETGPRRHLLSEVLGPAGDLVAAIRESPGCERAEVAGSARRWTETCKDVDLIAAARDPGPLVDALTSHQRTARVRSAGEGGASVLTHDGLAVDMRVVPPEEFGNLLQHFTGSAAHNVALREEAVRRGLKVSEHGIADNETGEVTRCATEEEVYERLGYAWIPPELREGRGELDAARADELPDLVEVTDIRGDLHCHTTLSDGKGTLREMVDTAVGRGYEYLAVTDHSASHGFGNHVTPDALRERIEEVAALNEELGDGFRVLAGSEVNVLTDGGLDYPDDLLAELDWVIASVHTSFRLDVGRMTDRIVAAARNPHVRCIGHLTGRLIGRRDGYDVDVDRVIEACLETGTMLEINGNPNRRDVNEHTARLAAEAGVPIVCTTDAHRPRTLAFMAFSVATARRGWLTAGQIANTNGVDELLATGAG